MLNGRVALVTGANHGIGAAVAAALASAGAAVLLTGLRAAPDTGQRAEYMAQRAMSSDQAALAIREAGGRALGVEADLSDPDAPERLLERAERDFGGVDILVNNASGWAQDTFAAASRDTHGRPTGAVSAASYDANFGVDARAAALLIAGFARRHRERGATWGRIIGLTSGGPEGFPTEVSYGAAKAAQENYTMAAATELAAQGITANMVYPPVTDTGWITDSVRALVARSPGHVHIATPMQVAEVVLWLCSDAAALVTGNVVHLR